MTRRRLLGASVVAGVAMVGVPWWRHEDGSENLPPLPTGGPTRGALAFSDDFDSLQSLDVSGQSHPKWFTDLPFSWGKNKTHFSVADSVLTIEQHQYDANWAMSTWSPSGKTGQTFGHGYYEARMRFDPTLGADSDGWPAFWSLTRKHISGTVDTWAELDFFEAYTGGHTTWDQKFYGTIHEWYSQPHGANISSQSPLNSTYSADGWHVYGCEWRSSQVVWFLDDHAVGIQLLGDSCAPRCDVRGWGALNVPTGKLSELDNSTGDMAVILGCGSGWPLEVDWVRVWE